MFAWFLVVVVLLVLCEGDPDIIDGWRQQANGKCFPVEVQK
jgi:hypothetical protein